MSTTTVPMIGLDDTPRARRTDPTTAHKAADKSVSRELVNVWIERALIAEGKPATADRIYHLIRDEFGHMCTKERVRTVLNEGAGLSKRESVRFDSFRRLDETGLSDNGNPSHLWCLA